MADTIKSALRSLQDEFATLDLLLRPKNSSAYEFLVKRYQNIALRIDGHKNHRRPHIHIDYGSERHIASYAINNGERLAGDLDRNYDRLVRTWISDNREKLMEAWDITQSGQKPEAIIAELKASEMG